MMRKNSENLGNVELAYANVQRQRIYNALGLNAHDEQDQLAGIISELSVLGEIGSTELNGSVRKRALESFQLLKSDGLQGSQVEKYFSLLRTSCLAVIADRTADAKKLLVDEEFVIFVEPSEWGDYVAAIVFSAWLSLIRKNGKKEVVRASESTAYLQSIQLSYEAKWLENIEATEKKQKAIELVVLYNLSAAAKRLADYTTTGSSDGTGDIRAQLDMNFERAFAALQYATNFELYGLSVLLHSTAIQLVQNSLQTAVRSANNLSQRFAKNLIERSYQPIFELLPPQRSALTDNGLMSAARRSIVVNLPTSSGKTLIAQFSILQALSDIGNERGFVAYIAPTRALVNQIATKLRQDFKELEIRVERLSPALEFDSVEISILNGEQAGEPAVKVLVCTPEKFDLLMRRDDVESTIGKLALVVVDEAHNIGANDSRAIKLELLLTMINREHQHARFLLLTPFISNAKNVASWLDSTNHQDYSISANWVPNDRIIGLSLPPLEAKNATLLGEVRLKTLHTPKNTLFIEEEVVLPGVSPKLKITQAVSKKTLSKLAIATTQVLSERGPTVLMCRTVQDTWTSAQTLKKSFEENALDDEDIQAVAARFVEYELGKNFPLSDYIKSGVGVHNAGLPDEVSQLIELLFANRKLHTISATSTLAQGVNFPIANLVLASIDVPKRGPMEYSSFWNIAGRVGRVDQDNVGVVAIASCTDVQQKRHEQYVGNALRDLQSKLIGMANELYEARENKTLKDFVFLNEWSSFAQYITHTFRKVGPARFAQELELVLRGTFGYASLREGNIVVAQHLLRETQRYAANLAGDMGAVKLVDSTGFTVESVKRALYELTQINAPESMLDGNSLFQTDNSTLRQVMGILLKIPEIKDGLEFGKGTDGNKLASLISDWVSGSSIPDLAKEYFHQDDEVKRISECMKQIKKISSSTSWGLAALISMKFGKALEEMSAQEKQQAANVPSMALYGVSGAGSIALRSVGVPRCAASSLVSYKESLVTNGSVYKLRESLYRGPEDWQNALGNRKGKDCHKVWSILEGLNT